MEELKKMEEAKDKFFNQCDKTVEKLKEPTKEQWARWYNHKSNKERFMEEQELLEEDDEG